MVVREARRQDAAEVADVHVRSWQVAYRGLFGDDYLDGLRAEDRMAPYTVGDARPDGPTTLVAVVDATLCGFVSTGPSPDEDATGAGAVYALYVDPPAWGRGIGRSLLAEARARLHRRDSPRPSWGSTPATTELSVSTEPTDGSPTRAGAKSTCGACWPTKSAITALCPDADHPVPGG